MKKYADYRWLNPEGPSVGRVSVFDKKSQEFERTTFIEFVDEPEKIKFQREYYETVSDFVQRLGTIADVIAKFTEHLNSTETKRMRKSEVTFQHEAEVRILAPEIKENYKTNKGVKNDTI